MHFIPMPPFSLSLSLRLFGADFSLSLSRSCRIQYINSDSDEFFFSLRFSTFAPGRCYQRSLFTLHREDKMFHTPARGHQPVAAYPDKPPKKERNEVGGKRRKCRKKKNKKQIDFCVSVCDTFQNDRQPLAERWQCADKLLLYDADADFQMNCYNCFQPKISNTKKCNFSLCHLYHSPRPHFERDKKLDAISFWRASHLIVILIRSSRLCVLQMMNRKMELYLISSRSSGSCSTLHIVSGTKRRK